jgi:pyrrolidone-carboxylate peptidase
MQNLEGVRNIYIVVLLTLLSLFCSCKPRRVVVTAFKPFGGRAINSSEVILEKIKNADEKVPLSVDYNLAWPQLLQKLDPKPDKLVMLGEYKGKEVRVDLLASLNGVTYQSKTAQKINFVKQNSVPGKFVCNYVYFKALEAGHNAVFVHIPEDYHEFEAVQKIVDMY